VPSLSVVVPHWPIDPEIDAALQRCLSSFPSECERIVVVNDGTGYARNVNTGLRLASAEFVAVVNNDCWLDEGDVYDLCVAETVTSPLVIGMRQGFGESIEPGGLHGCFWVVPRRVLDRIGLLDERFERAYFEDDDFLARLREANVPTRQISSVRSRHVGALSTLKVPEHRAWLAANEARFREKWGALPAERPRYRRAHGSGAWHFCQNCPDWPPADSEEAAAMGEDGWECAACRELRTRGDCAFY
jgi:GT2 family glycosyltransferase